jgi:hypothetical protein
MCNEKLMNGYKKLISTIFSPETYYKRIETNIENTSLNSKTKLNIYSILAFFKSIIKIGIFSYYRFLYWKLFFKMLSRNFKIFAHAIRYAITGEVYFKYARSIVMKPAEPDAPVSLPEADERT